MAAVGYGGDMKHAETKNLVARIVAVVQQSDFAKDVSRVDVEEASDEDGDTFLRVFLVTTKPNQFSWKRMARLVRQIEDDVAQVDDRFPSIRIAEAA